MTAALVVVPRPPAIVAMVPRMPQHIRWSRNPGRDWRSQRVRYASGESGAYR